MVPSCVRLHHIWNIWIRIYYNTCHSLFFSENLGSKRRNLPPRESTFNMVWLIIDACSFVGKKVQKAGPGGKRKPQCGPERIVFHHEHHDIYIEVQERRPGRRHTVLTFLYFFLAMSVLWRRDNYICKVLWSSTPVSFPCFCFQTLAFVFKRKKKAWPWLHKSPNCWKKWCTNCLWWFELNWNAKNAKNDYKAKAGDSSQKILFWQKPGKHFFPFKLQERLVRYWGRWIIFLGIWSGYKNSWVYNSWVCKMDV